MHIHIPTLYVYGFVVFARSLSREDTFPVVVLWLDLFEYDSLTGHFMKLECRIILVAHAAHVKSKNSARDCSYCTLTLVRA